jgi:hypothetical protein
MNVGGSLGIAIGVAMGTALDHIVAAVVASGAVFAQTDSDLASKDPQRQLLDQIAELRAN